ncbi:2'-deoxycytidine 5'-triphosphate deaminase, partial [uncultured Caulobacter sp.]
MSGTAAEAGIFSDAMIEGLVADRAILLPMPLANGQVQPASLDLR